MKTLRKASERGVEKTDWLESVHTFSFGHYWDPDHVGFGPLRVINEDKVASGKGFATHSHHNMEIVSWVLSGALEHKDSLGNTSVLKAGNLQVMSAGSGISHSEWNPTDEVTHFYQIWIEPRTQDGPPSYQEQAVAMGKGWVPLVMDSLTTNEAGALKIDQDVVVSLGTVADGQALKYTIASGRSVWLQVVEGELSLEGVEISAGDGVAISQEEGLAMSGAGVCLVFDLVV